MKRNSRYICLANFKNCSLLKKYNLFVNSNYTVPSISNMLNIKYLYQYILAKDIIFFGMNMPSISSSEAETEMCIS